MSREQRRRSKTQPTAGGSAARRTPVKVSGGSGFPVMPVAIGGGAIIVVALLAYLILQSVSGGSNLSGPDKAEADSSSSIPGSFVPSQGRGHYTGSWTKERPPTPFCPGVQWSGSASSEASPTPASAATATPAATTSPGVSPTVQSNCYASNPPSSGRHLNVQNNVDVGNGIVIKIPPDPDIYPPSVEVPRDSIAHILEHAGVFLGYNCADGDSACDDVVEQVTTLVTDRLENGGDRIVMAHDNDLVPGTIGMSSWTRIYVFRYQEYDAKETRRFLDKNSCRFDPEGFC